MGKKSKRNKKRKMAENNKGNGFETPKPEEPQPSSTSVPDTLDFCYVDLMPEELITIQPLMADYYNTNKHVWEPEISPEKMDKFFQVMQSSLVVNPQFGYIGKIFAAYDEKPDYPLEIIGEPVAYMWFYIARDMMGEPYLFIEHLYVKPDYRQFIEIHVKLNEIAAEYGKRARVKKIMLDTRTPKRQNDWKRYGFKVVSARMEFEGTIDDIMGVYFGRVLSLINRKVDKWEHPNLNQPTPRQKAY